jgi:tRNA-dihydrouridine synthase
MAQVDEAQKRGDIDAITAGNRRIQIEQEYKGELLDIIDAQKALAKAAEQYDKVLALTAARRQVASSGSFTNPELLDQERAHFEQLKTRPCIGSKRDIGPTNAGRYYPRIGDVKRLQIERLFTLSYKKAYRRCASWRRLPLLR